MAVMQHQYVSDYGWTISLPAGWEPLPCAGDQVVALHRPVVFACKNDSDLSLTWMIAGHPIKEQSAKRFLAVTDAEGAALADLMQIAPTIFPLIGKVDSCETVSLADGSRAIEVIETYFEDDDTKNGYQLIWPVKDVGNYPRTFQRLCFYAPAGKFKDNLPQIRSAAKSFRYTRPYGYCIP